MDKKLPGDYKKENPILLLRTRENPSILAIWNLESQNDDIGSYCLEQGICYDFITEDCFSHLSCQCPIFLYRHLSSFP